MNNELEDHAPISILSYTWKDSGVIYLLSISHQSRDTITVQWKSGASIIKVLALLIV
jgi:hypothetical protein